MNLKIIYTKGFSLFEVVITLFVFSLCLLSFTTLQIKTAQFNYAAYLHSVATSRINSLFERNLAGNMKKEFARWNKENSMLLPNGNGKFNKNIIVCWFDKTQKKIVCLNNHATPKSRFHSA